MMYIQYSINRISEKKLFFTILHLDVGKKKKEIELISKLNICDTKCHTQIDALVKNGEKYRKNEQFRILKKADILLLLIAS